MTKRLLPALLAAGFIGAIAAAPAHADLTVTWHMTMDSPMMKNMPPQTKAMMDGFLNPMTNYESGKLSRTDSPMMSTIIDRGTKKMYMIMKMSRTYTVTAFDPAKPSGMSIPGGGPVGGAKPADVKITDTGNTKSILGHRCHELIVTGKFEHQQGPNMTFKDDLWVAPDLLSGIPAMPFGGFGAADSKITGFPLEMSMTLSGGRADGTTVSIETTNISTDSIPSSTFQIPAGYTKSSAPGFGMPMGGGAPR